MKYVMCLIIFFIFIFCNFTFVSAFNKYIRYIYIYIYIYIFEIKLVLHFIVSVNKLLKKCFNG
jgi:hypothetical protein